MKPARKAISTPRGEGTRGTTGDREQVWGRGPGRLQTILPWYPLAPNLACTNEAAPRGESRDGHTAEIPHGHAAEILHGHTAETPEILHGHPAETSDSHPVMADEDVHRITVGGMCCVEGRTTPIPGEVVVCQPRGSNKNRGTSKGSLLESEWGKQVRALVTYLFPSRLDVAQRPHKHENAD